MMLYFVVFLASLVTVCFSIPRTTSAVPETNSFYVQRKSKVFGYVFSNHTKAESQRSLEPQASFRQDGLSGDSCTSNSDCKGSRTCQTTGAGRRCLFSGGIVRGCDSDEDCVPGERCYRDPDGNDVCLSERGAEEDNERAKEDNRAPTWVPIEGGPCIGIHLLTHLSRNELVFEKDILSNVLCDERNSCATAGHMVTYHGEGMMMKSYCKMIGGCTKKVMYVNSPRYNMKGTVPSFSENMVFTAFSARYVTRAEEGILAIAIKFGF